MSRLTADETLEMFLDGFDIDSGGELDIEEDPEFLLPHYSDSDNSDDERVRHDPGPSTSAAYHPSPTPLTFTA